MRTQQLVHRDTRTEKALAKLVQVLERHTLLCSTDNPIPGLPCFDTAASKSRWDRELRETVWDTLWGAAVISYGNDLGARSDLYSIMPVYRLLDGADVVSQAPEAGYAVIDTITGIVTVYRDAAPEDAVYNTRVHLDGRTGKKVLSDVWCNLALAGVPVCPLELYGDSTILYPWEDKEGFAVTHAANDEVSVPLVGYVLDPDTSEVVYLHIAGHKTALRSIWGTLSNGGSSQGLSIAASGSQHYAYSSHNYDTFSDDVDTDANLYRLIITDRRATDQEAEGSAYLVIPRQAEDLDLNEVFAARLNALLPIPVLPEWGKVLRGYGIRDTDLLTPCLCGGDVAKAFVIKADSGDKDDETIGGWLSLIKGLIQSGELSLTVE